MRARTIDRSIPWAVQSMFEMNELDRSTTTAASTTILNGDPFYFGKQTVVNMITLSNTHPNSNSVLYLHCLAYLLCNLNIFSAILQTSVPTTWNLEQQLPLKLHGQSWFMIGPRNLFSPRIPRLIQMLPGSASFLCSGIHQGWIFGRGV